MAKSTPRLKWWLGQIYVFQVVSAIPLHLLTCTTGISPVKSVDVILQIQVLPEGSCVTMDYRTDRVRLYTDGDGKVVQVPSIGWPRVSSSDSSCGDHNILCTDVNDDIILRIRCKTPKIDLPMYTNYRVTLIVTRHMYGFCFLGFFHLIREMFNSNFILFDMKCLNFCTIHKNKCKFYVGPQNDLQLIL